MLINFLLFQVGWFACVLSGANGLYWPFVAATAAAVLVRVCTAEPSRALLQIGIVTLLGSGSDAILTSLGVLRFAPTAITLAGLPLFMVGLWAVFATTLDSSMRWSQRFPLLSGLAGAVAGPVCYLAGERMGALTISGSLYALSVEWAVLMPVSALLTRRLCAPHRGSEDAINRS